MTNDTEPFFEALKKQVETSLHIVDAMVGASAKMRAAQLSAATQTRERVRALEQALAGSRNAQQMWDAEWKWALANCECSAAYWRGLFEAMGEANGVVGRCLQDGIRGAVPAAAGDGLASTGISAVDDAYRRMLESSQQLLRYTSAAFSAPVASGNGQMSKAPKAA